MPWPQSAFVAQGAVQKLTFGGAPKSLEQSRPSGHGTAESQYAPIPFSFPGVPFGGHCAGPASAVGFPASPADFPEVSDGFPPLSGGCPPLSGGFPGSLCWVVEPELS